MCDIFKDELGHKYDNWTVVYRSKIKHNSAIWNCQCSCGYIRLIYGVDLRRNKLPLCSNCCRKCRKTRQDTKFVGNKRICEDCVANDIKEWRRKNKEHLLENHTEWRNKNPEKISRYRTLERKRIQSDYTIFLRNKVKDLQRKHRRIFNNLDSRSISRSRKRNKTEINITVDYVINLWKSQDGKCAITKMQMEYSYNNLMSVSIDRIDSNNGYIIGNVQLVCKWVNYAKNEYSNEEIIKVLKSFKETGA